MEIYCNTPNQCSKNLEKKVRVSRLRSIIFGYNFRQTTVISRFEIHKAVDLKTPIIQMHIDLFYIMKLTKFDFNMTHNVNQICQIIKLINMSYSTQNYIYFTNKYCLKERVDFKP